MKQAEIYRKGLFAGILTEDDGEYRFCYDEMYLVREDAQPISLTLPLQTEPFVSPGIVPFFSTDLYLKVGCLTWHFATQT